MPQTGLPLFPCHRRTPQCCYQAKWSSSTIPTKDSNDGPATRPPLRRILIVDDQPLVRRGLQALVFDEPGLTICAQAATPRQALEAVAACRPDLVVTEIWLADGDGPTPVRQIRSLYQNLPVLVFSAHDAPHCAQAALDAGATDFVSKTQKSETLLRAIRRSFDGCARAGAKTGKS